jgi:N-acyl homoserine lactone hydrolase
LKVTEIKLIYPGFWGRFSWGTAEGPDMILGVSTVVLVQASGRNMLFDNGQFGTRGYLLSRLKDYELEPKDIDDVFVTHLHYDHAHNMELFPQATFVMHPDAIEAAVNAPPNDWAMLRDAPVFFRDKTIRHVRDGDEIAEGVVVMETPGHTACMLSLDIAMPEGRTVLGSDALTNAAALIHGEPGLVLYDHEAARKSIQRMASIAEIVYPGHERPFRWKDGAAEYLEEPRFRLHVRDWYGHGQDFTIHLTAPRTVLKP